MWRSVVAREVLRRMEAAELREELRQFEQAFAGSHDRAGTEEDVERVDAAVQAIACHTAATCSSNSTIKTRPWRFSKMRSD